MLDQDACIVIEERGILHLEGNDITLGGSGSVIVLKGTLSTKPNVDFTFTGPGYIDIHSSYKLAMGNGSNFRIERPATTNKERFIRVRENTTFTLSQRSLILEYGKVVLDEDAGMKVDFGSIDINETLFEGDGFNFTNENVALTSYNSKSCLVENCRFYDNHLGLEIVYDDAIVGGGIPGLSIPARVRQSSFENGYEGIMAEGDGELRIEGCTFESLHTYGMNIKGFYLARLNGNMVNGSTFITVPTLTLAEGLILDEVSNAYITDTKILDCINNGVRAHHSNVFVNDGSEIDGNDIGVLFENNLTAEYMLVVGACDCAAITNNRIGMTGKNMVLSIDAVEHANMCNLNVIRPNDFSGNQTAIDICYTDLTVNASDPILMKGNYWGSSPLSITGNYNIVSGLCYSSSAVNIPIDDANWTTSPATDCGMAMFQGPSPSPPQYPTGVAQKTECEIVQYGTTKQIHEQSRLAFYDFANENYSAALSGFQPVADLDKSTYNDPECVHKINFARCIVEGIANNQFALGYDEGWYEGVSQQINNGLNPVAISPNPATNNLQLLSPKNQQYDLHVYDLMGKILYKHPFISSYELTVDNWQRGLYIFVIYDEEGKRVQTSKVSVQ